MPLFDRGEAERLAFRKELLTALAAISSQLAEIIKQNNDGKDKLDDVIAALKENP